MNILTSTSLYFTEGRSDKEYHAEIAQVAGGHVVNFRYGRRGGTLTSGCKTPVPVDAEAARKIFGQLIRDKTAKGYTADFAGSPYTCATSTGRTTDELPQLLNPVSLKEARRLIEDEHWIAQPKMDGERRAAHAEGAEVFGINRKGLAVPLPEALAGELLALARRFGTLRVDGELIGETLHVFDLKGFEGRDLRSVPWQQRMSLAGELVKGCCSLKAVPMAITRKEKQSLWYAVQAADGEGLVFKRANSLIQAGRPNSGGDWLKFKFTASASCLVMAVNTGKRSVRIGLLGNGAAGHRIPDRPPISVGNVTIPPNHPIPTVGQVVEVSYLYAFPGGSLFQPVYRGERSDLDPDACTVGQLKMKPESD